MFSPKRVFPARVVTNSKGVTLETKSANELWSKVEQIPVTGMKAGIYLLGQAKKAETGQTYSGEIIYKDAAAVFQKTKKRACQAQCNT